MSSHVWVVEVLPRGSSRWRPVERAYDATLIVHSSRKAADAKRAEWAASVSPETARYRVAEYRRVGTVGG